MCTAQPVFQVSVNKLVTYLCGKCIAENTSDAIVKILNKNPVIGKTCQCGKCK